MNRRDNLKTMAAAAMAAAGNSMAATPAGIQLHVDLNVAPGKEQQLVSFYHASFAPAMKKQKGFTETKLLKLNSVKMAPGPPNATHRMLVCFDSEENRVKWVASPEHVALWPKMEACLHGSKFAAILYDIA